MTVLIVSVGCIAIVLLAWIIFSKPAKRPYSAASQPRAVSVPAPEPHVDMGDSSEKTYDVDGVRDAQFRERLRSIGGLPDSVLAEPRHTILTDREQEFSKPPVIEEPGVWHIRVAGATHPTRVGNVSRKSIYKKLVPGQILRVEREPENPFDSNAVCFWLDSGVGPALDLGFVPRSWASTLASLMDRRAEFAATG